MSDREKMAEEIRAQMSDALAKVREQHRAELRTAEIRGMQRGFEIAEEYAGVTYQLDDPNPEKGTGEVLVPEFVTARIWLERAIAELEKGEGEDG